MPTLKTCFKCETRKPLRMFYKHPQMADGHLGKCRSCTKKDVAKNYEDQRDQYAAYERKRFKDPKRRAKLAEYQKRRQIESPGRYRASYAVSNAIRDGRLSRQPCEKCGAKAQAHHDDYRRPLVVRWLCFKHHREHHGQKVN